MVRVNVEVTTSRAFCLWDVEDIELGCDKSLGDEDCEEEPESFRTPVD